MESIGRAKNLIDSLSAFNSLAAMLVTWEMKSKPRLARAFRDEGIGTRFILLIHLDSLVRTLIAPHNSVTTKSRVNFTPFSFADKTIVLAVSL